MKEIFLAIATFVMVVVVAIAGALNIENAPILNLVLLAGLIAVTTPYAYATIKIAKATKEQADASVKMAEETTRQVVMASRPVIIQKTVAENETKFATFGSRGEFYCFEIYNAGNGPAIEIETSLLDKDKNPKESHRESFLRAGDSIQFAPSILVSVDEGTFYLVSEYQGILSRGSRQTWYQTWLPFKPRKASTEGKIYVNPGELEFREVSEKERIDAFGSGSKPQ